MFVVWLGVVAMVVVEVILATLSVGERLKGMAVKRVAMLGEWTAW